MRIRINDVTEKEAAAAVAALRVVFEVRSVVPWERWTRRDPNATTGAVRVDAVLPDWPTVEPGEQDPPPVRRPRRR
ncbi:hypothetical protein [Saccharothrix lopnurensis]|uniref:Uncharacterized protein n=1 Tax=Saccharothrix lopnurensis TaxID=1670621 RepID=A0ABW1P729_9PSEU